MSIEKKDEVIKSLVFETSNGKKIKVDSSVLQKMLSYRQVDLKDKESGGMLFARELIGVGHIIIDDISIPQKEDIQKRNFFRRSIKAHRAIIDYKWEESKGISNYIGEWHTHPEDIPNPSLTDMKSWKRILKTTVCDEESLFFIIVGNQKIGVWEGVLKTLTIQQLKVVC